MFNPNDYDGETLESAAHEEEAARMQSFDAGLCSYRAACAGGTLYERELAESALELTEAGIAEPIAISIAGWLASQTIARRAA